MSPLYFGSSDGPDAQAEAPAGGAAPERRLVTVMVADLVGSTSRIRDLDPETASDVLDANVRVMIQGIRSFGGTVTQLRGDGVVAIFGAPRTHGDVPTRACAAALEVLRRHVGYAADKDRPRLQIRIGIATGPVLMRTLQYDLGSHYDANGFVTSLAAKLEAAAAPDSILCDALTANMAGSHIAFEPVHDPALHDLVGDKQLSRVVGFAPNPPLLGVFGHDTLHGREADLATLDAYFAGAATGTPAIFVVAGASGVGKTAICRHAVGRYGSRQHPIVMVSGNRYGTLSAFSVLRALIRELIDAVRPDLEDIEAFRRWQARHRPDTPEFVRRAAADLIFHRGGFNPSELSGGFGGELLEGELAAILNDVMATGAAAVFVDDAQWVDAPSLRIIAEAAQALEGGYILLATRSADGLALPEGTGFLELKPLSEAAVRAWLRAELGTGRHDELRLLGLAQSFGMSALAVRQLIDALDAGQDRQSWAYMVPDAAAMGTPGDDDAVPPAIEFMISERIDALSPDALQLLQCAAVAGDEAPASRLQAVFDAPGSRFETVLAELEQSRLVSTWVGRLGRRIRFVHSAIRWVSYQRPNREARRQLHSSLFERLVAEDRGGDAADPAVVASHAQLAGRPVDSAYWHTRAARAAQMRAAFAEANELVDRARDAIADIKDRTARYKAIVKLAPAAVSARVYFGRAAEAGTLLREALAAAEGLGDPRAEAGILHLRAFATWKAGQHETSCRDARRVIEIAARLDDAQMKLAGMLSLLLASLDLGRFDDCVEIGRALLPAMAGEAKRGAYVFGEPLNIATSFVARAELELGREAEAQALLERAGASAEVEPRDFGHAGLLITYGRVLLRRGDIHLALRVLQAAHRWCVTTEIRNLRAIGTAWLATALVYCDRVPEAARLLDANTAFARPRTSGVYAAVHFRIAQSLVSAAQGETAAALAAADEAVELAERHAERGHLARALLSRGVLRQVLSATDKDVADGDLDEAIRLAAELRMPATYRDAERAKAALRQPVVGTSSGVVVALARPAGIRDGLCAYALN